MLLASGSAGAQGGIVLVQHAGKDAGVVTSSSLSFKSNNTAGNWLAVCIRAGRSGQVFTVTDSRGNTYHQAIQFNVTLDAPGGDTLGIFYAENIAGGANAITVSDTISGTLRFSILEYSGMATAGSLDASITAQGHGTSPSSGNAATSASGDLLLGAILTANPATFTAGSGYKIEETVPVEPNTKLIAEDQIQAAPGSASASALLAAADDWAAGLAAFKSANGTAAAPVITGLNPTSGRVGTSVTITGTNFGSSIGTVTFNGTPVTGAISWTPTRIDVTIPNGATTGSVVVTAGGLSSNGVSFTVIPGPAITNLSPTSGAVGTSVNITGAGFGSPQGGSTVTFNGTTANPTIWQSNSITVPVPSGATTGNVVVTVAGIPSNGLNFTVTSISVSVAPPTANVVAGTTAFFTATVQNDVANQSVVWSLSGAGCSGTTCGTVSTPSGPSQAQYTAPTTVPNPSTVVLTATSKADNTKSGQATITVVQPQVPNITGLNPTSGPINTLVSVAGTNFGASQNLSTITFNNVQASATNWSDTIVTAIVPSTASTGNVVVVVNGTASNGVPFTVTPPNPQITSMSSSSGAVGLSVTITGTGFSSVQGNSTVRFNGTIAAPTSWSPTSIVAPVPWGATTGNVLVTVGGVASNGVLFTVVPNITGLSPNSGPAGTSVMITGTGFGATQNQSTVTFNGTAATPAPGNWSDTLITVPVPAGATTGNVVVSVGGASSNGFAFTVTSSGAGIGIVQHASTDAGVTSSGSLTFRTANKAGNWIGVCIRAGRSGQIFTVTDSNGNKYHQAIQFNVTLDSPGGDTLGVFYAENIAAGTNTVTVSDTILGTMRFAVMEYSGVAVANSLDASVSAQGHSTSPNSGNAVTSANGDLLLGAILTANAAVFSAGNGFTIEETTPAEPSSKLMVEDQLQAAAGTALATASMGGADDWAAGLAAFKSASGAPPPPISVSVSPTPVTVATGGIQNFAANIQNDSLNKGVTWSLSGAGCSGTGCGTLTNVTVTSLTYQGPANVPSPASVTLNATSISDPSKSGSAAITLIKGTLSVSVSPKRSAVTLSQAQQLVATVVNDPQNAGVTWSVDGNNGGNTITGTISSTGLFTPGSQPGQHTIVATSVSDATVTTSVSTFVTDLAGLFTHHNDTSRTGQNLQEYALSPSTVSPATFGRLFSCNVDGFVYAQPLYVANLNVAGTIRNVVFIATEHDSVYAFDADSSSCTQLWKTSFLASGITTVPFADIGGTDDLIPEIGITSTPVIDVNAARLYVESKTKETVGSGCSSGSPCYVHRLHSLDLATGSEKLTAVVTAPNFVPLRHLQRPALLLSNGTIYLAFGSHGDIANYQGWLFAYDAATLAQKFAFSTTDPTSSSFAGAVWQGGAGPAVDAGGNIYFETGNGIFDADTGGRNYSDSVVKLSPSGTVMDYFTPFNESTLSASDVDLGSAGVIILPDSVGSATHPHLAIATGKVGVLYLLDQANLGRFHSGSNLDVQEVPVILNTTNLDGGIFGDPAYYNGSIYVVEVSDALRQFPIANGHISSTASSKSNNTFPLRGATPTVSANGIAGGLVWVMDLTGWQTNQPGILDVYDATDLTKLLFSSPSSGSGASGAAVKFTVPTVANGKVYVGCQGAFTVFGLLPN
jgi:hypothetical protein